MQHMTTPALQALIEKFQYLRCIFKDSQVLVQQNNSVQKLQLHNSKGLLPKRNKQFQSNKHDPIITGEKYLEFSISPRRQACARFFSTRGSRPSWHMSPSVTRIIQDVRARVRMVSFYSVSLAFPADKLDRKVSRETCRETLKIHRARDLREEMAFPDNKAR